MSSRAPVLFSLAVALHLACSRSPEALPSGQSRDAYLAILREDTDDHDAALERCAALGDPLLAGDCALVVANRAMFAHSTPLDLWCPRVPEGLWRSECMFMAAENARRRGDPARAAQLCLQAGPFLNDCGQHLWQTSVRELVRRPGPSAFPQLLPVAQDIHDAWAPLLSDSTDFESRFWLRFYQSAFEPRDRLALDACRVLPPPHAHRCLEAAAHLYRRRLEMALLPAGALPAFCQAVGKRPLPSQVAFLQGYLDAPDEAPLLQVVADVRQARCGG